MKILSLIVFYLFSVYVVLNARSLVWKKFKPFKFKICHHRKNAIQSTIRPLKPPSFTTAPSIASKKPIETTFASSKPHSSTTEPFTISKKPVETISTSSKPDSSTTEPPILSNTSATTNEPPAALCFDDDGPSISKNVDLNKTMEKINDFIFKSTIDYLKNRMLSGNVIISPYNHLGELTLLYLGSQGTFESSLRDQFGISENITKTAVLRHFKNDEEIEQERKKKGDESKAYDYNSAIRLWIDKRYPLRQCSVNLLGSDLITASNDPLDSLDRTKSWAFEATNNRYHNRFPYLGMVMMYSTTVVLCAFTHFEGPWVTPFKLKSIETRLFYSGSTTMNTIFTIFSGNLHYAKSEKLGVEILQLPNERAGLSMFIFLPVESNSSDGLETFLEKLRTDTTASSELKEYLKGVPSVKDCQVYLPRFKGFQFDQDLFVSRSADLDDFINGGEHTDQNIMSTYISALIVDVVNVEVADRPIANLPSHNPKRVYFNANHPFMFMVCDVKHMKILFAGIFNDPNDWGF